MSRKQVIGGPLEIKLEFWSSPVTVAESIGKAAVAADPGP